MDKLSTYKVNELKELSKKLGLSTHGSKLELISRISAVDATELQEAICDFEEDSVIANSEDEHELTMVSPTENANVSARRDNGKVQDLMRRELDLLRRENAVLERELRLAQQNGNGIVRPEQPPIAQAVPVAEMLTAAAPAPVVQIPTVRIKDIRDMLADFNGEKDTFDIWKGQAEILRTTYRLNEDAMKMLLSSHLKGKAQEWYHSTPAHLHCRSTNYMNAWIACSTSGEPS